MAKNNAAVKATSSNVDALTELEKLRAENAKLKAVVTRKERPFEMRVSPKTGVFSLYLGARYPVSLYPEQWERLFELSESIQDFVRDPKNLATFEAIQANRKK